MSEQRKAFTFKDKQLGKAKKSWSSCNNDMEFTAWLLEGLAQLEVTMVAKILRENTVYITTGDGRIKFEMI